MLRFANPDFATLLDLINKTVILKKNIFNPMWDTVDFMEQNSSSSNTKKFQAFNQDRLKFVQDLTPLIVCVEHFFDHFKSIFLASFFRNKVASEKYIALKT